MRLTQTVHNIKYEFMFSMAWIQPNVGNVNMWIISIVIVDVGPWYWLLMDVDLMVIVIVDADDVGKSIQILFSCSQYADFEGSTSARIHRFFFHCGLFELAWKWPLAR